MTSRYRVAVVGTGKRGVHHAAAFAANPRFELVGLADSDQKRLEAAAAKFGSAKSGTNTQKIVEEVNASGKAYLTQTKLHGRTIIRIGLGNVLTTERHLAEAWALIRKTAFQVGAIDPATPARSRPRAVR